MKLTKQDYRSEMDSVRAFPNGCLIKTKDSKDRLKFGSTYEMYVAFCQDDGKKEYEKKNDFRKGLKDLGYRIENSKKDGNQVYIFNARIAEMKQ